MWLAQRWADMDAWVCEALPATPPSRTEGAMLTDSSRLCKKSGRKIGGGRKEGRGKRRRGVEKAEGGHEEDTPGEPGPEAVECAAAHYTAFQQKRVLVLIARSILIATPQCCYKCTATARVAGRGRR